MASRKQKAAIKAAKLAVTTPTGRKATRLALRTGVPQDIAVRRAQAALPFLPDPEPRRSGRALKVVGVGVGIAGLAAVVTRRRRAQPTWPTATPEPATTAPDVKPTPTPAATTPAPSSAPKPSATPTPTPPAAGPSGHTPLTTPTPGAVDTTVESSSTVQSSPTPEPAAPPVHDPRYASPGDGRGSGEDGSGRIEGGERMAATTDEGAAPGGYDDGMLAVAVRHALLEGKPPRAVTIQVSSGVVTLSGNADSQQGADEMVREAEAVEGVKAVLPQFEIGQGGGAPSTGTEDH